METEEIDEVDAVQEGRRMGRLANRKGKVHVKLAPKDWVPAAERKRREADLKKFQPAPKREAAPVEDTSRVRKLRDETTVNEDLRTELEKKITGRTDLIADLDDETGEAHSLFLFGRDGRPIRDLKKISSLTGVSIRKLEIMAPVWKREALRLAREASPLFAMASTTKARTQHSLDLDRMRLAIDEFEENLPGVKAKDYGSKYRQLMLMRKEWQDAAGITSAINISQAMLLMEGKAMLEKATGVKADAGGEPEDLSAFDVDVEEVG